MLTFYSLLFIRVTRQPEFISFKIAIDSLIYDIYIYIYLLHHTPPTDWVDWGNFCNAFFKQPML